MQNDWRTVASASTVCAEDAFALLSEAGTTYRVSGDANWSVTVDKKLGEVVVETLGHKDRFTVLASLPSCNSNLVPALHKLAQKGLVHLKHPDTARLLTLERKVDSVLCIPRNLDKSGTLCVRALSNEHAFVANIDTGKATCGHVFSENRLHSWLFTAARIGDLSPCPTCASANADTMTLIGNDTPQPKSKRKPRKRKVGDDDDGGADRPPFSMDTWLAESKAAYEEVAGDPVKVNEKALEAMEKLAPSSKKSVVTATRVDMYQLLVKDKFLETSGKKAAAEAFVKTVLNDWTPGRAWQGVNSVNLSIILVAVVFNLSFDQSLVDLFADVEWHKAARDLASKKQPKQKRQRKDTAPKPSDEGEGKAEVFDLPKCSTPGKPNSMKRALQTELDKNPEGGLQFVVYNRNRCSEEIIRELAVGNLGSYQKVIQWAAGRLASVDPNMPQGFLLDHDTGSGKTVSMWLALGTAWAQSNVPQVVMGSTTPTEDGYKPKVLFVTNQALAKKKDAAKDVWAFYKAAGASAHVKFAEFKRDKSATMGTLWKKLDLENDRIISYKQLHNAILGQNPIGRAFYGYEIVNNPPNSTAPFSRTVRQTQKTRIKPEEFEASVKMESSHRRTGVSKIEKDNTAALEDAKNGNKYPLDGLRDAVIAIDEADMLFTTDSEIGTGVELIEKAVFHSYRTSGKNAVRLVLGTATPAHTDLNSTFRLLNMLITQDNERVHGVGTPGTNEKTNPTIKQLAGEDGTFTTARMRRYMNLLSNNISRVNVTNDTDHFPMRKRTHVDVPISSIARKAEYMKLLDRRLNSLRERDIDDDNDKSDKVFNESDKREAAVKAAVKITTTSKKDSSDDVEMEDADGSGDEDDDDEDGEEEVFKTAEELRNISQGLRKRANNFRRSAMLLPVGYEDRVVPDMYRLGHKNFDAAALADEIHNGGIPKMKAVLDNIRKIDTAYMEAHNGRLPKHAIVTDTPGDWGAVLVGACLSAAGYKWVPVKRSNVPGEYVTFAAREEAQRSNIPANLISEPVNSDNASFVVLHNSLLSMQVERDYERIPRSGYRAYTDYVVSNKKTLYNVMKLDEGASTKAAAAYGEMIDAIAGKPLYVDNDTGRFYTVSNVREGDERGDLFTLFKHGGSNYDNSSLEELMDLGLVQWVPIMTAKQQREASGYVTKKFNDRVNNFNGEIARIIIISPAYTAGIDLADVEYVHRLDPTERLKTKDTARLRKVIQEEGRAWRRCCDAGIRDVVYNGAVTTVEIFSYFLTMEPRPLAPTIDGLRQKRPLQIDSGASQATTATSHEDIVFVLLRDPAEQSALSTIRNYTTAIAFDCIASTPHVTKMPIYTGYTTMEDNVPLYRLPSKEGFVTADGNAWNYQQDASPPGERESVTLLRLLENAEVRYEPRPDTIADLEQKNIEMSLLSKLESMIGGLLWYQYQDTYTGLTDEDHLNRRADEMNAEFLHIYLDGESNYTRKLSVSGDDKLKKLAQQEGPIGMYRYWLEKANTIMGIQLLYNRSRRLAMAAFDTNGTWLLEPLVRAYMRSRFAEPHEKFSVISVVQNAIYQRDSVAEFLKAGGAPLARVLLAAGRMNSSVIGELVNFFSNRWGISKIQVLNAIVERPIVPGESKNDYRKALFEKLALNAHGRWNHLCSVMHDIFLPTERLETKDTTRKRINVSLSIFATTDANGYPWPVLPADNPFEPVVQKIAEPLLTDIDKENFAIAARFAEVYIRDLRETGVAVQTELYSFFASMARLLKHSNEIHVFIGYFVAFSMAALRNKSNSASAAADTQVVLKRAVRAANQSHIKRDLNQIELATLMFISTRSAGTRLLDALREFSSARGNSGLDVYSDGVKSLVDVRGSWRDLSNKLKNVASEGTYPIHMSVGAGKYQLFSPYESFDNSLKKPLFYYDESGHPISLEKLANRSWTVTLGTKLSSGEATINNVTEARNAMASGVLNEIVEEALRILYKSAFGRTESRKVARENIISGILSATDSSVSLQDLHKPFDTLWKLAGTPGSGDQFFNQDEDTQKKIISLRGRSLPESNIRVWPSFTAIAKAANSLFGNPLGRVLMNKFAMMGASADKYVSENTTNKHIAGVLLDTDIVNLWGNDPSTQYALFLNTAASAIDATGKAHALTDDTQDATVTVTSVNILEWLISNNFQAPTLTTFPLLISSHSADINQQFRSYNRMRGAVSPVSESSLIDQFVHWAQHIANLKSDIAASIDDDDKERDETELKQSLEFMDEVTTRLKFEMEHLSDDPRHAKEAEMGLATLIGYLQEEPDMAQYMTDYVQFLQDFRNAYRVPFPEDLVRSEGGEEEFEEGEEEMPPASHFGISISALPMRIVSPEHLKGDVVLPHAARRCVWSSSGKQGHLTLTKGYVVLESGNVLDAWKENEPIVVQHFT